MSLESGRLFEGVLEPLESQHSNSIKLEWKIASSREQNNIIFLKALQLVYEKCLEVERSTFYEDWREAVEIVLSVGMISELKLSGVIGAEGITFLGKLIDAVVHPLENRDDEDLYRKFKKELRDALAIVPESQRAFPLPVRDEV